VALTFPEIFDRLLAGGDLSLDEAQSTMASVLDGDATPGQIGALLLALRTKDVTVDELTGFVRALLDAAVPLELACEAIDTCGTGGSDQRRSAAFHVSTLSALVAAGAGVKVCKHGNRRASATSGSADVLEVLGVAMDLGPAGVARCVDDAGMGFCLAPRFHPGMRHPGPVRRELGVRTVFNLAAPLANPARVRRQIVGVADPTMAEKLVRVLEANGAERVMVVYGHDGLDELTTAAPSTIVELFEGEVRSYDVDPVGLGFPDVGSVPPGGSAEDNAELVKRVVGGEPGPHRDIVLLNAGAALVVAGRTTDLAAGIEAAAESIDSGAAASALDRLVSVSQQAKSEEASEG
jgi:anthranilate phosphoribosyltransferase